MQLDNKITYTKLDSVSDDEIDLKLILNIFIRHKKLIFRCGLAGLISGLLLSFLLKKTWQGEFQIVLSSDNSKKELSNLSPSLQSLSGLGEKRNQLKTQVAILKSPSVLIDIFEFVKKEKTIEDDSFKDMRFDDWRKSLSIKLEKGTSVLNLIYTDKRKDLILPVLKDISRSYQLYSGKKRLRNFKLSSNFFKDQIKLYDLKSKKSLEKAQQFGLKNDLILIKSDALESNKKSDPLMNVEAIRIKAANEIRLIDQRLDQIKNLQGDTDKILYMLDIINNSNTSSYKKIKKIDQDLIYLRLSFKDSDEQIQYLSKEREVLIKALKDELVEYLMVKKEDAKANIESAKREDGVLVKYKKLLTESARDEATLFRLENQYRALQVEQAKSKDPWELITNPTLLPYPIAPKKSKLLPIGLFTGVSIGMLGALYIDNKKGIIHSIDEVKQLTNYPILENLSLTNKEKLNESMDVLSNLSLLNVNGEIAITKIGEISEKEEKELKQALSTSLKGKKLVFTKGIGEATKFSNLLLIASLGYTKKEEFIKVNERLGIQNKEFIGILLTNNDILKT